MHSHTRSHVVLFTSLSLPVSSFVSQDLSQQDKDAACEAAVRQLINDLMYFTFSNDFSVNLDLADLT